MIELAEVWGFFITVSLIDFLKFIKSPIPNKNILLYIYIYITMMLVVLTVGRRTYVKTIPLFILYKYILYKFHLFLDCFHKYKLIYLFIKSKTTLYVISRLFS